MTAKEPVGWVCPNAVSKPISLSKATLSIYVTVSATLSENYVPQNLFTDCTSYIEVQDYELAVTFAVQR